MSKRLGEALFYVLTATLVEKKVLPMIGLSFLQQPTYLFGLPRAYGLLVLILSVTYLWVMMLGMTVAHSRTKYMELAEKDGEKEVKERYAYPNLYAQGTSKNARAYNCVQRSHQQILETFTGYIMTALLGGLEFPVTCSVFCALWLYSRKVWVKGYMESQGEPSKRYDHPFSGFFWTAMLVLWMTCCLSAISVLLGRNIFWDGILSGEFLSKKPF